MLFARRSILTLFSSALLLSACQTTPPNNTLRFSPSSPVVQFNTTNQKAILNILTRDLRQHKAISSYVYNGKIFKLMAQPEVAELFDQVIKQDLNAKGFKIAQTPAQSNTNVILTITHFYADVDQGNLRYKISANVQINVQVQGAKGQFSKNIGSTQSQEGAFTAKNENIQNVLGKTFEEVVQRIYQDQEIANAINRYAN
ncbi:YajG family lipoprotein [Avibacterium sp. 21-586]|uniref:YajG family lipoprotein n=1 Tax=Avibacterium sp. 21-586 TaxID=2911534 RepID=UPI0022480047|nr:YajG family lipoprotein [Avibacterium sp. 21-586]MCW9710786.1 YajG family lipoprotein [Avibacterium sp. 21-586]